MAMIFDVKHFAVHDGPGIRTTVFFKGCPLRCVWCHNPEGLKGGYELAYSAEKCVLCGKCRQVCEHGVHSFSNTHLLDLSRCNHCGECEKICPSSAITLYGKELTVKELLPELLEDKDFYGSDGGVTLSGGECLLQADFCGELLCELKKMGIHTAVDTCGYVKKEEIDKVIPFTDLFLYDIKAYDEDVHIRCTGKSNKCILENLLYICSLGKPVEIRIPFVPFFNDGQIDKIGRFLSPIKEITAVKVLAYHNFSGSKYTSLGKICDLPKVLPEKEDIQRATEILRSYGLVCK